MAVKGRTKSSKAAKKTGSAAPKRKAAAKAKAAKTAARSGKKPAAPREERRKEARDRAWKALKTLRTALEQSGKPLTHWVDLLDRVGGPELGHGTLVRILAETQKLDRWPANCIVLHYRGLYGFGENAELMDHQDQLDVLGPWK